MKLSRPKKISTLPAPDITGNSHGNDSKHEIPLLNFLTGVSSAVRINKIKLNSAEKSKFYVFFFLASTLLEKNFAVS